MVFFSGKMSSTGKTEAIGPMERTNVEKQDLGA